METMQSLLPFTGQVQSGSQGTRGDLDQLEQNTAVSSRRELTILIFLPSLGFTVCVYVCV